MTAKRNDVQHDGGGAGGMPEPLRAFAPPGGTVAEQLQRIESLHRKYEEGRANGLVLANVMEALRVELTYHSNAIEGNTLSLRETQLVIEGLTPPGGKPLREIYEARNHDRALRMIERWAIERPAASPLTERDLLDIHSVVMADPDARGAGRYREHRVLIAGSRFVPPGPDRFGEILSLVLARSSDAVRHPVLCAAELHYNLVAVHPFADGNGRSARLMMAYLMLRNGYPPPIIVVERRKAYLDALAAADEGRPAEFLALVADAVEQTLMRVLGS